MMKRGAGYAGYSMSNNAVSAYENNERPLSRWTLALVKAYIAEQEGIEVEDFEIVGFWKSLLKKTSWHHTSSRYNRTDFYSVFYSDDDISLSAEGEAKIKARDFAAISHSLSEATKNLNAVLAFDIKASVIIKDNSELANGAVNLDFSTNAEEMKIIGKPESVIRLCDIKYAEIHISLLEEARLAKIESLEKSISNLQAKLAKLA